MADTETTETRQRLIDVLSSSSETAAPPVGSSKYNTYDDNIRGIDTIGNAIVMPELETPGITFITRPRLNLSTPSIRADRILSMVDTLDKDSISLGIRASLDTYLEQIYPEITLGSGPRFIELQNPFIPILTNRLQSLNGWPDPVLEVETSDVGFFGESITYPKGFDQLSKAYTLTANFNEIQGSYVMSLFLIWSRYLERMTRGATTQYPQDIENRRMGFTSSIYRFTLDPSKRFIVKWAKATGCFPQSNNLGKYFNYDRSGTGEANREPVSIQFSVAGNVTYFEPIILAEFNTLVQRYCKNIASWKPCVGMEARISNNYKTMPYINLKDGTNELQWRYK